MRFRQQLASAETIDELSGLYEEWPKVTIRAVCDRRKRLGYGKPNQRREPQKPRLTRENKGPSPM
jgi:hypothetical protein